MSTLNTFAYSTVTGYFIQDDSATVAETFEFVICRFVTIPSTEFNEKFRSPRTLDCLREHTKQMISMMIHRHRPNGSALNDKSNI